MSEGSLFDMSAYGSPQSDPEPESDDLHEPEDSDPAQPSAPAMAMPGFEPAPAPPANSREVANATPTALYRKYRPQTFESDDLFGQDHIVNTLRNAIALDRIAHAYLFCGPRGTGKTTTARILAKAVNCEHPDPLKRPCNACPSCVAINTGATTDVIEIDAASNRGIDDIRDLRERVKYAPSQLRTKFYIIDEAHQITGAAANAFLKTLEEPPAHTKFVLATTDPEDLLQTIVSRCQRFDFRRISLEAMIANLSKVANAERIDIDDDAKAIIARHATGSLRDAQGLLDQVAVYREHASDDNTVVTAELVRTVLGVSRNDRVEAIATALADRDAGAGVRAIGEAVAAGDDMRQLGRQLLTYMRELLLARSGSDSDLDDSGKQLAHRFQLGDLAELTRLIGDIDYKIKHATIAQLPLEIAVIEGALRGSLPAQPVANQGVQHQQTPTSAPVAQQHTEGALMPPPAGGSLMDRVRGTGRRPAASQPAAPVEQPAPPQRREQPAAATFQQPSAPTQPVAESAGGGEIDRVRSMWQQVKDDVRAVNVRTGALLSEMDPVAMEGNTVILTAPYPFHTRKMNSDDSRPVVEQVLGRLLGRPIKLECYTLEEFRARPAAPAPATATPPVTTPPVTQTQPERPVTSDEPDRQEPPRTVTPPTPGPDEVPVEAEPIDTQADQPEIDPTESLRAVRNIFDAVEIEQDSDLDN